MLYNPDAAKDIDTMIGHLMNPQLCGFSFDQVSRMNLFLAARSIEAVGLSNQRIAKSNKEG